MFQEAPFLKRILVVLLTVTIVSLLIAGGLMICLRSAQGYEIIDVYGIQRQYRLHIPPSYTGEEPVPLMLALHGGGGNARSFEKRSGFDEVSDKEGFIVAYPDAYGIFKYRLHAWNSGTIASLASRKKIDDVGFLMELINSLSTEYAINESQIYVTGHSNGAMITYCLAAECSGKIAPVAPVSGTIGGYEAEGAPLYHIPDPKEPVTVIHIHGRQDTHLPYDGGHGKNARGTRIDLSVNDSISFWINQNGCSPVPQVEKSSSDAITLERYGGGRDGTEVILVTLVNRGHSWQDMDDEFRPEQLHGQSLAEVIWNLLEGHPNQ